MANPGFEQPALGKITTGYQTPGKIVPGWLDASNPAVYTDTGVEAGGHTGSYEAYCKHGEGGAYQILTNQMQSGVVYTLTWWSHANSGNNSGQQVVSLVSASATNALYASTTTLSMISNTIAQGAFVQYSLTYTGAVSDVGNYIGVYFNNSPLSGAGWTSFDDFQVLGGLTITTQPVTQNILIGDPATFSVQTASGAGTVTYQWKRGPVGGPYTNLVNGGTISGVTSNILTISSVASSDDLAYVVMVTDSQTSVTSAPAILTSANLLSIVNPGFEQPALGKITSGYQTAGKVVPGWLNANNPPLYTDTGVETPGHTGSYSAYCKYGEGGACQILNYKIQSGDNFTLTWWAHANSGNNNGMQLVSLFSATNATEAYTNTTILATLASAVTQSYVQYTLTYAAQPGDVGKRLGIYFNNATNSTAGWTSFDDFVLVGNGLTITSQPQSQTNILGSTANFTVQASSGATPITYRWEFGTVGGPYTNLVDGVDGGGATISGSSSSSLTISGIASNDFGGYICHVVDSSLASTNTIEADLVQLMLTNLVITTPAQTIYVGYPAGAVWISGDYNNGTVSNLTAVSSYSAQNGGVFTVDAAGNMTAQSAGVDNLIVSNGVLSVTQQVTVLSGPPPIYLTNSLEGMSLPVGFNLNIGAADGGKNTVNFNANGTDFAGVGDNDRTYISTAYNAYNSVNFTAAIACPANAGNNVFFGIGQGIPNTTEPENSVYIRANGGSPSVQKGPFNGLGTFSAFPGGLGGVPFTMTLDYRTTSGVIKFTIATATTNQTVQLTLPGLSSGSTIFFGGSGGATFTNLVIFNPINPNDTVTNLYFVSTPPQLLYGNPAATPVQVLADYLSGSKSNDVTGALTYALADGGVVASVNSAGHLTAGTPGTTSLVATFQNVSAGTSISATQSVTTLAPIALSISVPSVYVGGASVNASLLANYSATITNINVTLFNDPLGPSDFGSVAGSWASSDSTVFSTGGTYGNTVTPTSGASVGASANLTASLYPLTATNQITLLAEPPFYQTQSFTGVTLPAGFNLNLASSSDIVAFTPGGAVFTTTSYRDYIATVVSDYNQSNFVATITVRTNNGFGAFFGIGSGIPNTGFFGEPLTSANLFMRARNGGANPDVNDGAYSFTAWPSGLGTGPFVLQMNYTNGVGVYFSIYTATANQTIGPISLPAFSTYSLFFGSANDSDTFYNLAITPTLTTPAPVTISQQLSGSSLTLTWNDGLLQQASSLSGPWTAVPGASAPSYTITVNPANPQVFYRVVEVY